MRKFYLFFVIFNLISFTEGLAQTKVNDIVLQISYAGSSKIAGSIANALSDVENVTEVKYCEQQDVFWIKYIPSGNQSSESILEKLKLLDYDFDIKTFTSVEQLNQICLEYKIMHIKRSSNLETQ